MGIVGWYHVKLMKSITEDRQFVLVSPEEYLDNMRKTLAAQPGVTEAEIERNIKQSGLAAFAKIEITEEGRIKTYMPLPKDVTPEMIEGAKASGCEVTDDGYFRPDQNEGYDWKEENGVFFYDTKEQREVLGEVQSSWDDLKFDGSTITMSHGMVIYEKD